ncbi:assimilatory sulfite reductase (NADPH) flavoprotein subunit [Buchnera aphidicola (Hyperomyzus lactucae)]|uniref:Sulfite reductase [NADPH] flavoprotein alpha-component n=1 Tax=Buchnera aphidicola (Hyperomyzus lactucae) TaxID=1241860 RepID=A0A4D6XX11_9GAMM|nr:assimilatory sulfite reductase (NADPH) flavoprotein subunit [Buchnera aphidicola]QCI21143.1 assimilatory sulfite reductase (NADPH) flavoprotein subunit [Buchnera aphidicola (Hyperomyzus lactucae)]
MKNHNMLDLLVPLSTEQLNCLKKLESTCSNIQCAWLSGYFWKAANHTSNSVSHKIINELNDKDQVITIISASQTGNGKLLSKRLYEYFNKNNKKSRLIDALDYKFKKIKDEKILILIISTQGEGEPPEEALSLYKFIMSKKAPKLDNLYYSIFGLGDTSYNLFCQAGKDFDKRFKELGASSLLDRLDADIEYEDMYNQWSKELLISINNKNIISNSSSLFSDKEDKSIISNPIYTKKNPAIATILTNQKITGRASKKDVHHIEIDIANLNINYTPGDAIGVWYKNDIHLVKKILELLSIKTSDIVKINTDTMTIFDALRNHFELTNNTKPIVRNYANFTKNKILKNIICSDVNLQNYVSETPLINMINNHPSKISAEQLISFLRPLTPRLYSISSSQAEIDNEIHITVGVVKKLISGCFHLGGASGYLSQLLKPDDVVRIFVETNNNFRLPLNKDTSIIMIGSGTGIAPFRSFIQQRDNDGSKGKNWIFFGNPSFTEDFLYQVEWQQYIKKGLLTKMNLAWSQDQEHKIYVQDKIRENGKEIWSWIQDGAQIYVCGNASKMAKDVEKALLDIISENSGMNFEDSDEYLNNLRMNQRYQRDVY